MTENLHMFKISFDLEIDIGSFTTPEDYAEYMEEGTYCAENLPDQLQEAIDRTRERESISEGYCAAMSIHRNLKVGVVPDPVLVVTETKQRREVTT